MLRAFKTKAAEFLRWQVTVGSRHALEDLDRRLDRIARLASEQSEFAREIAASTRRAHAEMRAMQDDMLQRLAQIEAVTQEVRRARTPFAYLGGHLGLATVATGHRLFVDTRDRQLTPHLATVGVWESWNERAIRAILRPGDVVVDGGSNYGYFVTLAAGLVGPIGRVYAFEANKDVAALLVDSVEINGFADRVNISTTAIADEQGTTRFVTFESLQASGWALPAREGRDTRDGVVSEVPTDRLDNLVPRGDIRLLRLDIEGGEPAAIRGARQLIERSPRLVILTEWGLEAGAGMDELRWLAGQGFRFNVMAHEGPPRPVSVEQAADLGLCDLLCTRGPLAELGLQGRV
jgi:FkbM family methyltransferase